MRSAYNGAQTPDLTKYDTVVINDFTDSVEKTESSSNVDINLEGQKFANIVAESMEKEAVFNKVLRKVENPEKNSLLIDGEITKYEEGNSALRLMVGMGAGSSYLDAKVYLRDGSTQELIGSMDVHKNSWPLGGAISAAQDVKFHMDSAATTISGEITKAKSKK